MTDEQVAFAELVMMQLTDTLRKLERVPRRLVNEGISPQKNADICTGLWSAIDELRALRDEAQRHYTRRNDI